MNLYEQVYVTIRDSRVGTNTPVQVAKRLTGKNLMEVINAINKLAQKKAIEQIELGGSQCYKAAPGISDFNY